MDDLKQWIEVLGAALIGLGGWLWGIGRRYQAMKNDLKNLEREDAKLAHDLGRLEGKLDSEAAILRQEIAVVEKARSESAAKIYERLDAIGRDQAAQGAQINHIMDTCNRTNQALMNMLAGRRAGGNRFYDQPEVQP